MSDAATGRAPTVAATQRPLRMPARKPHVRTRAKSKVDLSEFQLWLDRLPVAARPSIHVNGAAFESVVLVVDFGTPLRQSKLSAEDAADLSEHIRRATRAIAGSTASVRVSSDHHSGIWWSSLN